jgi:hypothetical protein
MLLSVKSLLHFAQLLGRRKEEEQEQDGGYASATVGRRWIAYLKFFAGILRVGLW